MIFSVQRTTKVMSERATSHQVRSVNVIISDSRHFKFEEDWGKIKLNEPRRQKLKNRNDLSPPSD